MTICFNPEGMGDAMSDEDRNSIKENDIRTRAQIEDEF